MTELGKGEQIWWGCLKILHHPARILKTWIWAHWLRVKHFDLYAVSEWKWMQRKFLLYRKALLRVRVFGGCLNSGRLSVCAQTCCFAETVINCIHPVVSNLNTVDNPARDYWGPCFWICPPQCVVLMKKVKTTFMHPLYYRAMTRKENSSVYRLK